MAKTPEDQARENIDSMVEKADWHIYDLKDANISSHCGVVIRNFPLKSGHGFADYLFYLNGKAAGVIEAKRAGTALSGVEIQSGKYTKGLPDGLPAWGNPLPFAYESTAEETQFTNGLDPDPRSRNIFSFHRPETLADMLTGGASLDQAADPFAAYNAILRFKLRRMPPQRNFSSFSLLIRHINLLRNILFNSLNQTR